MNYIYFILNNQKYFEDFITRSTYHSNAIEGSTLTFAETYAILFNDNSLTINGREPREIYEAINHKKAMMLLFDKLKSDDITLSENFIKQINEIINVDILNTKGYRHVQVMIRGSEHIPPAPEQVNNLMVYFTHNYNHEVEEDVFIKIAKYHIEFESIHPFEDGNGRTGRLLLNFELLKNNLPPVVIPKEERTTYFEYLRNKDIEGLSIWLRKLSSEEKIRMDAFKN